MTTGHDEADGAKPDEVAIDVKNLTKAYGATTAVDDVSFTVRRGAVTALLGPNGSGKSTTMRLMVGLARSDSGTVLFEGRPYQELERPAAVVGILLDASAQHGGRSVRESAQLAGRLAGVSNDRTERCLQTVGLGDVGRRRVGALSLGMRQRLGLAIALLASPEILILDEPGNGLDPEGLAWLTDFMAQFARAGGAVLVSSHHLADIERVADDLVVLDRGVVRFAGAADDLSQARERTKARSADDEKFLRCLLEAGVAASTESGGGIIADIAPAEIGRYSVEFGIPLTALSSAGGSLERYFLDNTSGEYQGRRDDLMHLSDRAEQQ